MADKDYDIACKLRDCLNQLVHGKVTEKKKQVENLKSFLGSTTALAHLNRSTAIRRRKDVVSGNVILITWAKVFSHVKDYIEQEAEKLREREGTTEIASNIVLANRKKDKYMCCDLFRYFIKAVKSNEQYYLCMQVMEHILAVMTNSFTLSTFGLEYSVILQKEILCEPFMCLNIAENTFNEAINIYCKIIRNPPPGWDRSILSHILHQLLLAHCNMYELQTPTILKFFSMIFDSLRQEKASRHHENLLNSLILVCQSLKSSCPYQLCQIGETIMLPIIQLWYTRPPESCKNLMLEFIFLQLTLHRHMETLKEIEKPMWSEDWSSWKNHLQQLYQMTLKEITDVCGKNKYSTSKESILKPNFIAVAVEICAQAFKYCSNSLELTQMSFSCDPSGVSKKRRIEVSFQTLVEGLSCSSSSGEMVPWLQLISAFLLKYPQIISIEQIENVYEVLIPFHLTCNQLDTKNWLLYCCQTVVHAICSNKGAIDCCCDWQRLWELGVRSVLLMHQCAENGHRLLATMLFYKLVIPKAEFFNLYTPGSSNTVTKFSLQSLVIYLQKYSLPSNILSSIPQNSVNHCETNTLPFRNQVLEWIFSRKNDDNSPFQILSSDVEPFTYELFARVIALLCLQSTNFNFDTQPNFEVTEPFQWISDVEEELLFVTFNLPYNHFDKEKKNNKQSSITPGTLLKTLWDKSLEFFLNAASHVVEEQLCSNENSGSTIYVKLAYIMFEMLQIFYFQGLIKEEDLPIHQLTSILKKSLSNAAECEKKKQNKEVNSSDSIILLQDFILYVLVTLNQKQNSSFSVSFKPFAMVIIDSIPSNFLNLLLNLCLETVSEPSTLLPGCSNSSFNEEFDEFNETHLIGRKTSTGRRNRFLPAQDTSMQVDSAEPFELTLETKDSVQLMNIKSLPESTQLQLQCLNVMCQLFTFISNNNFKQLQPFIESVNTSFINASKVKRKGIRKAADIHLLLGMSRCILSNSELESNLVGEVLKSIKEILNKFGKLQDVCVATIEVFSVVYPHLPLKETESSSGSLINKDHLLHLHLVFWKKEFEGKAMSETSLALAKTMLTLIQLEPAIQWKKPPINVTSANRSGDVDPNSFLYQCFASLIKSSHHQVRLFVASHIKHIFALCPNIDAQSRLFEDLYVKCASLLELKNDTKDVKTVDEKFHLLSTLFHFLRCVVLHAPTSERDALFYVCKLVQNKETSQLQAVKILNHISNSLGYKTLKEFVEPRLSYLVYKWLHSHFPIVEFPYMILNEDSVQSFLSNYHTVFVPPLFYTFNLEPINDIAKELNLNTSDLIYSCLPAIQSQIICWLSANPDDDRAIKCKGSLENLVPLEIIDATFRNKLDDIVICLLTMLKGDSEEDFILKDTELKINLCSISTQEFHSTITYIMSKIEWDGSFVSFLCQKEDNVQKILMHLSLSLSKAKRCHEQRHVIQMYQLFLDLLLPELYSCLKNSSTFIVRDVIYSIIHFLTNESLNRCDEKNFACCIEIIHLVCERALQCFPEDLGLILPFIVSSLMSFGKESIVGNMVLSLFSLLIIESEDCLSDYVQYLDPFPQNQVFCHLYQRQKQLLYHNKPPTLKEEMKNFLMSFKMTGKVTKDGLSHLLKQLSSKHDEVQEMLDSFQEKVLFSEDVKSSTFHQLVCKLIHLCTPGIATIEVQTEASRCLGVIGPVAFSTTILQPSSFSGGEEENYDMFITYEFILGLLADYLIDQRIDIKVTASDVLKSVFSTKLSQDFLTAFKIRRENNVLLRHIHPFYASCKGVKLKSCCMFELNVASIRVDSLWLPETNSHSQWIKNLVCTILESGITKSNFLENLLPLCKKEASFCAKCLPHLIYVALLQKKEEVQETLSYGVSLFFASLSSWLETNSAGKASPTTDLGTPSAHFDRASVQTMLSVIYYLWLHPKKQTKESGNVVHEFWLSLNYLQVAQAAQFCSAYFTAILYTEMWCDVSREKKRNESMQEQMKSDFGSQSSSPFSVCSEDRQKTSLVYDILMNAYSSIGDPDAIHGCEEVATDSQSIVRHSYLIEKKWEELLRLYDKDNSSMGMLQMLQMCGLNNVLQGYIKSLIPSQNQTSPEIIEYQYQCAWRMNKWNVPLSETEKPGFYESMYKSQQCLNVANKIGFNKNLETARLKLLESLSHTSLESTRNVLPILCNLQMLSTLESFSESLSENSLEAVHALMENWEVQGRFPFEDFEFVEPVLWLRCMLLHRQTQSDFSQHTVFPKLARFLESYIEVSRKETSLETASSALHTLQSLPTSDEEDVLRWEMEHAKILWIKKEHPIAIKILKSLLQNIEKHEESTGLLKLYGEALTLEGQWLAETCSENSVIIMQEYLEKAVAVLDRASREEGSSGERVIWNAYLSVARYADAQYQSIVDYKKSTAYQMKQELMQHSREEAEKLTNKDISDDSKKTRLILTKQLNIDNEELKNLDSDQQQFLMKSITHYLKCLHGTDTHDLWIFRLISLWFENLANAEVNNLISSHIESLHTYKFLPVMYQLAARMGTQVYFPFSKNLSLLIIRIAIDHPHHSLPIILALANANKDPTDNKKQASSSSSKRTPFQQSDLPAIKERMLAAEKILSKLQHSKVNAVLRDTTILCDAYISLAYLSAADLVAKKQKKGKIPESEQIRKLRNLSNIPIITEDIKVDRSCKYSDIVGIHSFHPEYSLCGGITVPKVIKCMGMDGKEREQLVKGRDDLRQDAVMQQVFSLVNNLLRQKIETKRRKLCIRTYKVVPVSRRSGVIQWCEGTQVLSQYLTGPVPPGGAHRKYYPKMAGHLDTQRKMKTIAGYSFLSRKLEVFDSLCKDFPPVFRYFFLENFPEPCAWFERRQSYTKSVAASSIVGYILGLGDRHVNNILVDKNTAEVVHIDFGIAFEKGRILATPETVPFRLTRDIVDGMGISGVEGTFKRCCEKTLEVMRNSQDVLLTILEVLLYDPLYDWTVPASKTPLQRNRSPNTEHLEVNKLAERALMRLQQKLHGLEDGVSLSISGQVNLLVQQARDPNNLCRLYAGWQPYL